MSEISRKWLEAAKILGPDPYQKVICPECNIGHLMVKDELIESWNKIDRYLICDNCGKWNVMTMAIPENYPIDSPIDTSKKG